MRTPTDGELDALAELEADARPRGPAVIADEYDAAFPTVELTDAEVEVMYAAWRRDGHDDEGGGTGEYPW